MNRGNKNIYETQEINVQRSKEKEIDIELNKVKINVVDLCCCISFKTNSFKPDLKSFMKSEEFNICIIVIEKRGFSRFILKLYFIFYSNV